MIFYRYIKQGAKTMATTRIFIKMQAAEANRDGVEKRAVAA